MMVGLFVSRSSGERVIWYLQVGETDGVWVIDRPSISEAVRQSGVGKFVWLPKRCIARVSVS